MQPDFKRFPQTTYLYRKKVPIFAVGHNMKKETAYSGLTK